MAAGKDDESTAEMPALDAHESYGSLDTSNSKPSSKSKSKSTVAVAKMTSCVCDMPVCGRNKWTVVLVVDGKDDTVLFGAGATNNMCAKPFGEHHGKVPTSTQMGVHQKGGACFSAMTTTRHGKIPKTDTPWPRPVILLKIFDDCAALMIDEQRAGTANHGIKWGGDALGWLLPVDLLETDVQLRNALKGMVLKMYTKGGGDKTMTGGSPQWQLVALTAMLADVRSAAPNKSNPMLDVVLKKLKEIGSKALWNVMTVEAAQDLLTVVAERQDDLSNSLEDSRNGIRAQAQMLVTDRAQTREAIEGVMRMKEDLEKQKADATDAKNASASERLVLKQQFEAAVKKLEIQMAALLVKLTKSQQMLESLSKEKHACDVDEIQSVVKVAQEELREMLVAVEKVIAEMNVEWTIKFDELTASLNSFKAQHTKRLEIVEERIDGLVLDIEEIRLHMGRQDLLLHEHSKDILALRTGNRVTSPSRRSSLENEEDEPDWLKHAASIFNSHDSAKGDVALGNDASRPLQLAKSRLTQEQEDKVEVLQNLGLAAVVSSLHDKVEAILTTNVCSDFAENAKTQGFLLVAADGGCDGWLDTAVRAAQQGSPLPPLADYAARPLHGTIVLFNGFEKKAETDMTVVLQCLGASIATLFSVHVTHLITEKPPKKFIKVCMDSFPFCRLVKREWLQHVEESGVTSTKGYEWTLTITRFVNPTVPIPTTSPTEHGITPPSPQGAPPPRCSPCSQAEECSPAAASPAALVDGGRGSPDNIQSPLIEAPFLMSPAPTAARPMDPETRSTRGGSVSFRTPSLGGRMSGGSPLSGGSDCGATPKHASRRFLSPFVKPDPKLAAGLEKLATSLAVGKAVSAVEEAAEEAALLAQFEAEQVEAEAEEAAAAAAVQAREAQDAAITAAEAEAREAAREAAEATKVEHVAAVEKIEAAAKAAAKESGAKCEADLAGLRKEMQAQSDKEKQAQSDMHAEEMRQQMKTMYIVIFVMLFAMLSAMLYQNIVF